MPGILEQPPVANANAVLSKHGDDRKEPVTLYGLQQQRPIVVMYTEKHIAIMLYAIKQNLYYVKMYTFY